MMVLDRRARILSRTFASSFSDNSCFNIFRSFDVSVLDERDTQNVHFESWFDSHDGAEPSRLRQSNTFHINSSSAGSSQTPHFSSGVTYSGQCNLANLITSVMSCVVLMTDGTNEFIIEEYKMSFIFDLRVFARLHMNMWLSQDDRPMIALCTCGTCIIFNKESVISEVLVC